MHLPARRCALMDSSSHNQKNRYEFTTRLEWPPATARTGAEYNCAGLIEAASRASTFEAQRRGFYAHTPLEIPGTPWLGHAGCRSREPQPGPDARCRGTEVVLGEPLSNLLSDDALIAEGTTRRQEALQFSGTGYNPRSGGATVAPRLGRTGRPANRTRSLRAAEAQTGPRSGTSRRLGARPRRRRSETRQLPPP